MNVVTRSLAIVLLLALGAAACSSGDDAATESSEPRTDEELAIGWWEWATSEPSATNPIVDETGAHCELNQPSDVWFLANTLSGNANRACTIGQTEVFFPVLTALCGGDGSCKTQYDDANVSASLDGQPVSVIEIDTEAGEITMEPGNPTEPEGGEFRVVAAGWWVRLPPLEAGDHVLTFSGSSDDVELTVQYDLVVAP